MTGRDRTTRTRARAPGVSGKPTEWRCEIEPTGPTQSGATVEVTRRTKDGRKPYADQRMPGAGLSCATWWEGLRLKGQPSSRTGENSPYGMIGGIEETSASFEARSAPRSYPTWLCKNATRYNRTRNFEPYDRAESKKTQKFVFRSALRPNQISFSHSQDPEKTWRRRRPVLLPCPTNALSSKPCGLSRCRRIESVRRILPKCWLQDQYHQLGD